MRYPAAACVLRGEDADVRRLLLGKKKLLSIAASENSKDYPVKDNT
jgi:hypothetical protein